MVDTRTTCVNAESPHNSLNMQRLFKGSVKRLSEIRCRQTTPWSLMPFLYLTITFSAVCGVQLSCSPHVFWNQRWIIRKTWVGDLTVSSKPGVSTKTIRSPYFGCLTRTASTWAVVASKVCPVRWLGWPVRRSINYILLSLSQLIALPSYVTLSSSYWTNKPT